MQKVLYHEQICKLLEKLSKLENEHEDFADKQEKYDSTFFYHKGVASGLRRAMGEILTMTGHIKVS